MTSLPLARRLTAVATLLLTTWTLTACEAPHVRTEAKALVDQLGAIDHVSAASFAYEDLGGWEADEIEYRIDVDPDLGPEAVAQVASAVYTTVRDDRDVTQAAVSATLHVGDDLLTLRIYESLTDADEVASVVEALVPELDRGLTTLEVDTSMRGADAPVDLSVNQAPDRPLDPAQVRRSEAAWQEVIDRVGRGGVYVGR